MRYNPRFLCLWTAGLLGLTLCGCQGDSSVSEASVAATGITVSCGSDTFPTAFATTMKQYFEAVEQQDYAGYQQTVYPAYQTAYDAYLQGKKGIDGETAFKQLREQFDEDGYESWQFTELELDFCDSEEIDNFFSTWVKAGVFDEAFVTACKAEATEIRDVQFTLYARYAGDDAAVPVVKNGEMIVMQTADHVWLFG